VSAFYDEVAQSALDQIREAGRLVVIRQIESAFNPVTGGQEVATKIEGNFIAVKLPLTSGDARNLEEHLQEALTAGRLAKILIPAKDVPFEPKISNVVVIDSDVFRVVSRRVLNPAGTPLLYTLILEAGAISQVDEDAITIDIDALEAAVAGLTAAVNEFHVMVHETLPVNLN
jgi:hypothetical protein